VSETATSASEAPQSHGVEKRRSTRVVRAVPIIVVASDALGQTFRESTSTLMVDCYGCKFQSKNYIPKSSAVTVEIFHAPGWDRRVVHARVVWVQRPRTHRENFQIAVEMDVPGNVWGVHPSPNDWFPHPEDAAQAPIEVLDPVPPETTEAATANEDQDVSSEQDIAGQDELDNEAEEITFTREQLDGELREAIGKTLRSMIEKAAEDAVRDLVQDVADRTSEIVEAARRISQETAEDVDAKLRSVLDETVKSLQIDIPKSLAPKRRRKSHKRDA
jgi:hypothetical protein